MNKKLSFILAAICTSLCISFTANAQLAAYGNGSNGDLIINSGQTISNLNSYYRVTAVSGDTITLNHPLPLTGSQNVKVFFSIVSRNNYNNFKTFFDTLVFTYSATNTYVVPHYRYPSIQPNSNNFIQMLLVPL